MSTGPLTLASVDEAHASLQVIAREIAAALGEARVALEAYVEHPTTAARCIAARPTSHGAGRAARRSRSTARSLLAEEMEQVARYVDLHSGEGGAEQPRRSTR